MTNRSFLERISPLWLGISISVLLILILLVNETIQGRWSEMLTDGHFDALAEVSTGDLRDLRIAIVHCLVVGYLPAALLQVMRSAKRTVLVLQDSLECSPQECRKLAETVRLDVGRLVIIGTLGFVLSMITPYLVPPIPEAPWNPSTWSTEVAWHRVLGPVTMVWAWWLGYAVVSVSLRMSRVAKKLNRINLFDLSPLSPFTQQGLTNALLLIGSVSIWSLVLIETGFGQISLVVGTITLAVAILSLIAPVQGVHKRIRQAKQREIEWLDTEISKLRDTFPDPKAVRQSGEMADLISYRGLVENVTEWPFTSMTYARLVLYTLIPVITWSFGVFAEELINRIFLG
jgi:hypothetical protein